MVDLGSIYILSSFSTPTERASGFPEAIVLSVTIFPSFGSQPTNQPPPPSSSYITKHGEEGTECPRMLYNPATCITKRSKIVKMEEAL